MNKKDFFSNPQNVPANSDQSFRVYYHSFTNIIHIFILRDPCCRIVTVLAQTKRDKKSVNILICVNICPRLSAGVGRLLAQRLR